MIPYSSIIIFTCTVSFKGHELNKSLIVDGILEILLGISEPYEIFFWQVHPPALHIFTNVAQNVGKLECNTEINRIVTGTRIAVAKNLDTCESHQRGHMIAIVIKFFERTIMGSCQVHFYAINDSRKMYLLNRKPPYGIRQGQRNRMTR